MDKFYFFMLHLLIQSLFLLRIITKLSDKIGIYIGILSTAKTDDITVETEQDIVPLRPGLDKAAKKRKQVGNLTDFDKN